MTTSTSITSTSGHPNVRSISQSPKAALVQTAKHLVKLIKNGDDLIITHGNGPQVGQGDELLTILCHLDVVPAGDLSNLKTLPFEATIKNDHLVGRWVQDDKGPSMAALSLPDDY